MPRSQVIWLVVVMVAVPLRAAPFADEPPPPITQTHLKVGNPAPPFKFTDRDGTERALADFRGRYVLIDLSLIHI